MIDEKHTLEKRLLKLKGSQQQNKEIRQQSEEMKMLSESVKKRSEALAQKDKEIRSLESNKNEALQDST
jgi:hypothetical protein